MSVISQGVVASVTTSVLIEKLGWGERLRNESDIDALPLLPSRPIHFAANALQCIVNGEETPKMPLPL